MKWPWRRRKYDLVIDDRFWRRVAEDKRAYWEEHPRDDVRITVRKEVKQPDDHR